ncbi:MAG: lipid-binding SYLF domain-containing protein [Chitinophagaceae bacterium]|nr:lipid-binding SYLF domain-containing protein [Chitinophagaceae bacterium]
MKIVLSIFFTFLLAITSNNVNAQQKEVNRIDDAVRVLREFANMKGNIPQELLNISEGIIIVPKMINAGFVIAGKRGRGIALVRNDDGSWSNPAFVTITGGSVGFQAGVQSVDLVLIFRHRETLENIGEGTFTLGGDVSATAGPLGRSGSATTDYKFEAEVYSYSKSKGLFAGISLSGSAISVDDNANNLFYGQDLEPAEIYALSNGGNASVSTLKTVLVGLYQDGIE